MVVVCIYAYNVHMKIIQKLVSLALLLYSLSNLAEGIRNIIFSVGYGYFPTNGLIHIILAVFFLLAARSVWQSARASTDINNQIHNPTTYSARSLVEFIIGIIAIFMGLATIYSYIALGGFEGFDPSKGFDARNVLTVAWLLVITFPTIGGGLIILRKFFRIR
jgi:hypothetical protein